MLGISDLIFSFKGSHWEGEWCCVSEYCVENGLQRWKWEDQFRGYWKSPCKIRLHPEKEGAGSMKRWQHMWGRIHRTSWYTLISESETVLQNDMGCGGSVTVNFALMPKFQWRCCKCSYFPQHLPREKTGDVSSLDDPSKVSALAHEQLNLEGCVLY